MIRGNKGANLTCLFLKAQVTRQVPFFSIYFASVAGTRQKFTVFAKWAQDFIRTSSSSPSAFESQFDGESRYHSKKAGEKAASTAMATSHYLTDCLGNSCCNSFKAAAKGGRH
jgi:hypothetical protein